MRELRGEMAGPHRDPSGTRPGRPEPGLWGLCPAVAEPLEELGGKGKERERERKGIPTLHPPTQPHSCQKIPPEDGKPETRNLLSSWEPQTRALGRKLKLFPLFFLISLPRLLRALRGFLRTQGMAPIAKGRIWAGIPPWTGPVKAFLISHIILCSFTLHRSHSQLLKSEFEREMKLI